MLKLKTLFGFALVAATIVIGVHAWNNYSTKTEPVGVLTKCFGQPPHGGVKCDPRPTLPPRCYDAQGAVVSCPSPNAKAPPVINAPLPITKPVVIPAVRPCPTVSKKIYSKKKSVLVKARHHKSKMSHHHKSKMSHHGGHHHGGHHHGGHHHGGHHHGHSGAPHTGPPGCR